MLTGTNLIFTKEYNLRIVHETVRLHGPLSRAEIARRTNLSAQTVSNLVKELMASGLIIEAEKQWEGRGAPSIALTLNPDGAYAIGLDLNRDHLTGVLVDLSGTVRQRIYHALHFPTPEEASELMAEAVRALIQRQGLSGDEVWGVGIGVPGPMKPQDGFYLISPRSFPGWHNVPIAHWLQENLQLPVFLENNATAAAIGERWYGAGQFIGTFFYIYFDSGLGGGLVVQGHPFEGHAGNAGKVGYLPVRAIEVQPEAGIPSHVGEYFNLPRLYRQLQAQGAEAGTLDDLARLFAEAFPPLLQWIDRGADHLTRLVLTVECLFDPEAVFFGGRLSDTILQALLQRVQQQLPHRHIGHADNAPRYLQATAGVDAAALGVATLPIYAFFAPTHRVLLKHSNDPTHPILNTPRSQTHSR